MPGVGGLVHGVQVHSSLEFGLTTGQEHDTGDCGGNAAAEHLQGVVSNLLGTSTALALSTGGDHGRFKEDTLEENVVISEVLEGLGPSALSDLKSAVNVVVTIKENLGLDNGDKTRVLGNGGITGKAVGAVSDSGGGGTSGDRDDRAPLGETGTLLVVLVATLGKTVKASAPRLAVGVGERVETLVDLDTGNKSLLVQAGNHGLSRADVLEESLLEENGTGDVLAETGGGHEQLTVSLTVLNGVLEANGFETLAAGGVGLVHGENTLARGGNLLLHLVEGMKQSTFSHIGT